MTPDPYAPGILKPEVHERLVANLENFALDAGIRPHWIYEPLPASVSPAEVKYLRAYTVVLCLFEEATESFEFASH